MKCCFSLGLALLLLLTGCVAPQPAAGSEPPPSPPPSAEVSASLPDPEPEPEPDPRQETIGALLASMTLEEKVGQLFFARCPAKDGAALAAEYHLGGYLLFLQDFQDAEKNWLTEEQFTQQIRSYQEASSIPMLIGTDEEGGTVARASRNPNLFPKKCGSPQEVAKRDGEGDVFAEDAREKNSALLRCGINVNLAPVCDVSTDPKSFIYNRTLGKDAAATAEYITSVVTAMRECGEGSVLKHFPGYGENADTHTGSAVDQRSLEAFRKSDFLPFQAGIQAGGGTTAVMVSHNIVTAMDPDRPASLSPDVYQILREELGFEGPALTDDLIMKAITQYAEKQSPAVLALAAGCDMVITSDFQKEIPQVFSALESGTLSQERVDEAVSHVLGWKYDLGLIT